MSEIDEKYIEEAESACFRPQMSIWKRVGSFAACAALVAAICTFPIWGQFDNPEIGSEINLENLEGNEVVWDAKTGVFILKNHNYNLYDTGADASGTNIAEVTTTTESCTEGATVIGNANTDSTEDKKATPDVLYPYIMGEYAGYSIAQGRVMEDKVGEKLGKVTMAGADGATTGAELYAIMGVDIKCAVAVKYPKYASYCIFYNPDVTFASFAEFKAAYSLDTELYMGVVMVEHIVADNYDRLVELKGISPLKEKLLALDGVSCTYEEFVAQCNMKKSIGFDVAQGAVWRYACGGLQIFADGYLVTNLSGGLLIFDIGKDAAKALIADAEENGYHGVNFYNEKRDILVDERTSDSEKEPSVPETSEAVTPWEAPTSGDADLMTPSYEPHKPATEETEIAEETKTEQGLYDTNGLIYEGKDPYAWTSEDVAMETTEKVNGLIYEGEDPYAMSKETTQTRGILD